MRTIKYGFLCGVVALAEISELLPEEIEFTQRRK